MIEDSPSKAICKMLQLSGYTARESSKICAIAAYSSIGAATCRPGLTYDGVKRIVQDFEEYIEAVKEATYSEIHHITTEDN